MLAEVAAARALSRACFLRVRFFLRFLVTRLGCRSDSPTTSRRRSLGRSVGRSADWRAARWFVAAADERASEPESYQGSGG